MATVRLHHSALKGRSNIGMELAALMTSVQPDKTKYEKVEVLKQEALSRAAVTELKGIAHTIPNQNILINAIVLREAKASSELENIFINKQLMELLRNT